MRLGIAVAACILLAGCAAPPSAPSRGPGANSGGAGGWKTLAEGPVARLESAAAVLDGRIYVIAGMFPGSVLELGRVDVYDIANATWSRGPDLPVPVHHASAVALGPRILLLGGYLSTDSTATAATWILDGANATSWTLGPVLPEPRAAHAAVSDGTRVWVFGGTDGATLLASAWRLDGVSPGHTWQPIADLPEPRDHLGAAFLDGKAFAFGGRRLSLDTNTGRADAYEPSTNSWVRIADMPTPRGGIGAATDGRRAYVFGGEEPRRALDVVESYDPSSHQWRAEPTMPEPRHGMPAVPWNGTFYIEGGGAQAGFAHSRTNWAFRPS